MPKVFVLSTLYLILFLFLPLVSGAQTNEYEFPTVEVDDSYHFRHLTTDDGLPTNRTHHVLQDSRGFIWISTRVGICRYDGYNVKTYKYGRVITIPENMVEDNEGNIWYTTLNGLIKLNIYTESYTEYNHDPADPGSISEDFTLCVYKDRSGTIWIGTANTGLNRYYPETDKFRSFELAPDPQSWSNYIRALYEDDSGVLWVGTLDGLFCFHRDNENFSEIKVSSVMGERISNLSIRSISQDTDGNMLFGTDHGFLQFDSISNELVLSYLIFNENARIECINLKSDPINGNHIVWFIWQLLFKYDKYSGITTKITDHDPTNQTDIIGIDLSTIYYDQSGLMWIPGNWGVNISKPEQYQIQKYLDSTNKYRNATAFLKDSKNHLWIGYFDNILIHYDEQMNPVRIYNKSDFPVEEGEIKYGSPTHVIYEDNESNIWYGDCTNGLYLIKHRSDELIHCSLIGDETPTSAFILDIFEDSHGDIWVAENFGLYVHKKNKHPITIFEKVDLGEAEGSQGIMCILEDHLGNLWIGSSESGLFCRTPENRNTNVFINFAFDPENDQSLSNNLVWAIYEDINGNLWVGTENGLNRFIREENAFERFINEEDPSSTFIMDMTGDDHGYLWMITQKGLMRFIPKLSTGQEIDYEIKQILPFDDLCPFNLDRTSDGKIYIGGKFGSGIQYYCIDPRKMNENKYIPPVFITDFRVRNEKYILDSSITAKEHIKLNYNENYFSFEFAALDYHDPAENQYAYYLEGFEDEWIYSGTRRNAYYTGVPPGEYTFRAKGSNNDGYWNEEGVSVHLSIFPPPWKTWWAYIIYGIFIIGLIYAWRKYDLKRQRLKQELEMEHLEAEKLKELDSMKSRFFANISHEFRTPLTLILGPLQKLFSKSVDEETKQDLNIMQRNARRLQNLINQLLDLSKLESGKMELKVQERDAIPLIKGYVQSFESLAKQKGIDLVFHSERDDISFWVDQDKLDKILLNLLSNAFKYTSEGGRIEVAALGSTGLQVGRSTGLQVLSSTGNRRPTDLPTHRTLESEKYIEISISDTGPGIPPDKLPHIFDRFYQADNSYTKVGEGTGIGLALTRELVELHHGKIEVESEVGKGTSFRVYLPLGTYHLTDKEKDTSQQLLDEEKKSQVTYRKSHITSQDVGNGTKIEEPGTQNSEPGTSGEKRIILIVEDNPDLRQYIRGYLYQTYHIIEAKDGEQGLEIAIENVLDLIISDVMMPKMDGYELCKKLKTDERTSHIPVILLTARASLESKLEGLETGADDFITKPFEPQELQTRIRNLIELRKNLQERFMSNIKKLGLEHLMDLETPDMKSTDQLFMQKAINLVIENISDPDLNVDKLSSDLFISRRQLHRKMVAITGDSPNKFIRTLRLNRAAELLRSKTGNITEIAFEVGFNNLSYFAKSFKEEFGVLPSDVK